MIAPMMRSRLNGNPCHVNGHGAHCERVTERRPVERAQEKREWRRIVDRECRTANNTNEGLSS